MKRIILFVFLVLVFSLSGMTKSENLLVESYQSEVKGNYQSALTKMFAATNLEPGNAFYNLRTGYLYYMLANYTEARSYYHKSYDIDKNYDALEGLLTNTYLLNDWVSTIDYGKKVLSQYPDNYLVNCKVAYAYYSCEDWVNACKYYKVASKIYDYDLDCMSYYLDSLMKNNSISVAKKVYSKLKKLNPANYVVKKYEDQLK